MTTLGGGRIRLRPVREDDHPDVLRWQNDPEVAWWMDYERTFTLQDIHESEARAVEEGHPFLIEADGRAIGRIGLNGFSERDQTCSLYVFIGEREVWSMGYGTDAMRTLLAWGFDAFALHLVQLWSLSTNARAIRAYEKVGFQIDGVLRERSRKSDGRRYDRTYMSITREEFESTSPP
ncbi:MAG TPA: GNAT family protein [Actinomycetota bacterium]|nr:GNAT family protein [Actinomycetota bacterium]